MPYPNEHAARVRDPGSFKPNSFRSKDLKDGVRLILGKLKSGNDSMVVQAYRFSVDNFTVEQAKKWLEDNKIKFIKFEPAQNVLEHVGVIGMKWGHRKAQSRSSSSSKRVRVKSDSTNSKKVAKVEKSWNKVKNKPLKKYDEKAIRRGQMIARGILVAVIFGPDLIRGASSVGKFGVSIGKRKISDYKFNKYGGFDPKNVVNAKFWDAPIRPLTSNLLGGGT